MFPLDFAGIQLHYILELKLAVFALETDYLSRTDNQSSKSVKIDGKPDE